MGQDKAFVDVGGRTMVEWVAAALRGAGCDPVVVVGGDADRLAAAGFEVVGDRWRGEGPLGGVLTALTHTARTHPGRPTVVVACDLPRLDAATVRRLVDAAGTGAADVVMAESGGPDGAAPRLEPLCAWWAAGAAAALQRAFDAGERAIHRSLDGMQVRTVAVGLDVVLNVNRPADVPRGQQ